MTQMSYPWPGVAPASGPDAGRYTAPQWNAAWAALVRSGGVIKSVPGLRTLASLANIGVYYSVDNKLAVTSPGNNDISIDTGAALVCGKTVYNDTAITGVNNITSPAVNPRIDRVVFRVNFTAVNYVPASASAADFTVLGKSARITIIHGAENAVPVAPVLTQDATLATYWDIPLAQYQISALGVITGLTDEREWVDAEIKQFSVPFASVYNATAMTDTVHRGIGGIGMIDNELCTAQTVFVIPSDFITGLEISFLIEHSFAGNAYISADWDAGFDGVDESLMNGGVAYAAVPLALYLGALPTYHVVLPMYPAGVAAGWFVNAAFNRDSRNALDTINQYVLADACLVKYLGWR